MPSEARRSTYRKHGKGGVLYRVKRRIEKAKAQVRARVEHPFRAIKRPFGYVKARFRDLAKNGAWWVTLFALSSLWMARKHLLVAGEARPYAGSLPCKALLKGKIMDLQSGIGLNFRGAAVF